MEMTATDVKNSFGKILKLLDYEDVYVKKNGRVIAKITKCSVPLMKSGRVCETASDYQTSKDKRVTYDEYLKLVATSDKRYELIDGHVYMLASPRVTHQRIVGDLHLQLHQFLVGKDCEAFISPFDVTIKIDDDYNVVQPDLGIICDPENVDDNDRYTGIPALVIEVASPSSVSKDLVKKLQLYMLSGIREYWFINPFNKTVNVYTFNDYEVDEYKSFHMDEEVQSIIYKGLKVDLKKYC